MASTKNCRHAIVIIAISTVLSANSNTSTVYTPGTQKQHGIVNAHHSVKQQKQLNE